MTVENLISLFIIGLIVHTAKSSRVIGYLMIAFYSAFIIIELDYLGFATGNLYIGHERAVISYLIQTAICFVFMMLFVITYTFTGKKTALYYSAWIIFNMFITGLSAIFQALETNTLIMMYNVVQHINLIVDILVVIIGTDNVVRRTKYATRTINRISAINDRYINFCASHRGKATKCQPTT